MRRYTLLWFILDMHGLLSWQYCSDTDWYCSATDQCVALNETCAGTCHTHQSPIIRRKRHHGPPYDYNNDLYYCHMTDTCISGDEPCGTTCHPRKVPVPDDRDHYYSFVYRHYCDNKCYESLSEEVVKCRNSAKGCKEDQHYCERLGVCQSNNQTCSDSCNYERSDCCIFGYKYCELSGTCIPNRESCIQLYGCNDGEWFCSLSQSCISLDKPCDGKCADYPYEARFYCQEEDICKPYSHLCGQSCDSGIDNSYPHLYCPETRSCLPHDVHCDNGCDSNQWYCRETEKCQSLSKPCFGQCPTHVMYNTEKQKCDHVQAGCTDKEWACPDSDTGCVAISQPCRKWQHSHGHLYNVGKDGCIMSYRGKWYGYVFCSATNTCLHKSVPCNGKCSNPYFTYPLLKYCNVSNSCVNNGKSCGGTCLAKNRFKCISEDKCIHKSKVNDGKFDCSDKSDEDIHGEEDIRRAFYKLFKL